MFIDKPALSKQVFIIVNGDFQLEGDTLYVYFLRNWSWNEINMHEYFCKCIVNTMSNDLPVLSPFIQVSITYLQKFQSKGVNMYVNLNLYVNFKGRVKFQLTSQFLALSNRCQLLFYGNFKVKG